MAGATGTSGSGAVRLRLRYADVAAFVDGYWPHVTRAGVFIPARVQRDLGAEVRFELLLDGDLVALSGVGKVRSLRSGADGQPAGLVLEFVRVTKDSRDRIMRILEVRRVHAAVDGDDGMPVAPTVAPTPTPRPATVMAPAVPPAPTPAPVATVTAVASTSAVPVGPDAAALADLSARLALPAEPTRRLRPRPISVIRDAASGPTGVSVEPRPAHLDALLARARELAASRDLDGVPVAVDVNEASAKLAALFGTGRVERVPRHRPDAGTPVAQRPLAPVPAAPAPPAAPSPPADHAPVDSTGSIEFTDDDVLSEEPDHPPDQRLAQAIERALEDDDGDDQPTAGFDVSMRTVMASPFADEPTQAVDEDPPAHANTLARALDALDGLDGLDDPDPADA